MNHTELFAAVTNKMSEHFNHPLLNGCLVRPMIDADKVRFLIEIFAASGHDEAEIIEYSCAVMFMQVALDTHDLVNLSEDGKEADDERQLLILSGDYYNGLYYQILANSKQRRLIAPLALAIKEINELKVMTRYERPGNKEMLVRTNTLLLLRLCEVFDLMALYDEIIQFFMGSEREGVLV